MSISTHWVFLSISSIQININICHGHSKGMLSYMCSIFNFFKKNFDPLFIISKSPVEYFWKVDNLIQCIRIRLIEVLNNLINLLFFFFLILSVITTVQPRSEASLRFFQSSRSGTSESRVLQWWLWNVSIHHISYLFHWPF